MIAKFLVTVLLVVVAWVVVSRMTRRPRRRAPPAGRRRAQIETETLERCPVCEAYVAAGPCGRSDCPRV